MPAGKSLPRLRQRRQRRTTSLIEHSRGLTGLHQTELLAFYPSQRPYIRDRRVKARTKEVEAEADVEGEVAVEAVEDEEVKALRAKRRVREQPLHRF